MHSTSTLLPRGSVLPSALLSVVVALALLTGSSPVMAANYHRGGGNGAAAQRARLIAAAQQQLSVGRQALSEAESVAAAARSEINSANAHRRGTQND